MKISRIARLPLRSILTSRLLFSCVSQCHSRLRSSFRLGNPLYQLSHHQLRLKSALLGLFNYMLKVVVLAQTVLDFVVQSKITRQPTFTIRLNQRDQIDALHHGMMLSPAATNKKYNVSMSKAIFRNAPSEG
jgi:hypothetical protein